MSVERLPRDTIDNLRAGRNVSTFDQLVEELVLNEATTIHISISLRDFSVQVVDNGCGISAENMHNIGFWHTLPEQYTASGRRGEALASIAMIATLSVASSLSRSTLKLHRGDRQDIFTVSPERGTTVIAEDIFWNLPVRRAILVDGGSSVVEQVRRRVERMVVANPSVSFRLVNESNTVLLSTHQSANVVDAMFQLYGSRVADVLCNVEETSPHYRVSGYISAAACTYPSKQSERSWGRSFQLLVPIIRKGVETVLSINGCVFAEVHLLILADNAVLQTRCYAAFALFIECKPSDADMAFSNKGVEVAFRYPDELSTALSILIQRHCNVQLTKTDAAREALLDSALDLSHDRIAQPQGSFLDRSSRTVRSSHTEVAEPAPLRSQSGIKASATIGLKRGWTESTADESDAIFIHGPSGNSYVWVNSISQPLHSSWKRPAPITPSPQARSAPIVSRTPSETSKTSLSSTFRPPARVVSALGGQGIGLQAHQISREDIHTMTIVGQADQKFIIAENNLQLYYLKSLSRSLWYAIDQHAADERIQLEGLMKQLHLHDPAIIWKTVLSVPYFIEVSDADVVSLERFSAELGKWCIEYVSLGTRLSVFSVPTLCGTALEARHVMEYVHALEATGGGCEAPPRCLRILASKACRSAIMFGDSLSVSECEHLLAKLWDCRVPFQCAHGRPSIYPLLQIQ